MELSAELVAELTEGAHYEMDPPFTSLRDARRVRVTMEATVVRLNGDRPNSPLNAANSSVQNVAQNAALPVTIRDLSSRGVGIECAMTVRVHDEFAIRLFRRDGSPLWIHCAVTRWQPIGKNINVIGARFTRIFVPPRPAAAEGAAPGEAPVPAEISSQV